jgi:hypothetical protein
MFENHWPYQDPGYQQPYSDNSLTIEEFIDKIQNALTMSCMLPKILADAEIRRIIQDMALNHFYANYYYAVSSVFFWVPKRGFTRDPNNAKTNWIQLPHDVQNVKYTYAVSQRELFSIGTTPIAASVELGSNQAYMPSFLQQIGDYGVYRVTLDAFSDMINYLQKQTHVFEYEWSTQRLQVQSNMSYDLIIEAYARIPAENLFKDQYFYLYVLALARRQMADLISFYDFPLPGGIKMNAAALQASADKDFALVAEQIKASNNPAWFYMVRR